jgi:hypothetical protein
MKMHGHRLLTSKQILTYALTRVELNITDIYIYVCMCMSTNTFDQQQFSYLLHFLIYVRQNIVNTLTFAASHRFY